LEKSHSLFAPFPYRAKIISLFLIIPGLFFGYLYFFGSRPTFFETKVFAVVSTYMENRFFVLARTNILDELFAILCISGLVLFVFSKEKIEKEGYDQLRARALIKSVYITLIFWLASFLLVFGYAIFLVSAFLFIFFLITYYVVFRVLVHKTLKALKVNS
jgi:apolipoprotein N-acyltransferase